MLARDPQRSYYPEEDKKKPRKKQQKPKRRVKRRSSVNKSTYVLFAIIFLGISLLLLSRYASITSIRSEITQLENKKEELIKDKTNLEATLEGIKSSEMVSQEAIIKLGMNYPEEGQIAYVEVPEKLSKREDDSALKDSLKNAIEAVQIFFRR